MHIPPNAIVSAKAVGFGRESRKSVAIGTLPDDSVAELTALMKKAPVDVVTGPCFAVIVHDPRGKELFGGTRYIPEGSITHMGRGSAFPAPIVR